MTMFWKRLLIIEKDYKKWKHAAYIRSINLDEISRGSGASEVNAILYGVPNGSKHIMGGYRTNMGGHRTIMGGHRTIMGGHRIKCAVTAHIVR